jgi:hypothetical protein
MKARSHRIVLLAALALTVGALPVPVAQAQPVDFEKETHFRCYVISQQTPEAARTVTLSDQFLQGVTETPDEPLQFCAPTSKNGLPILEPEEHLTFYEAPERLTPHLSVSTEDQFGARTLRVVSAHYLLVPSEKEELGEPRRLNHYWCYDATGPRVGATVTLEDQFGSDTVRVEKPRLFCNPVEKISAAGRERIVEREVHLTCYDIFGPQATEATQFSASNQFETDMFTVTSWDYLCVPSAKVGFAPAS